MNILFYYSFVSAEKMTKTRIAEVMIFGVPASRCLVVVVVAVSG